MIAASKKPSRRFSSAQQQELLSRHQFCECLDVIGWISSSVETDMGEDLFVRIYDSGDTTGLSFYVQLKSTADSGKRGHKKTRTLGYPLEVKDLEHWEKQATLVVLVLWDVKRREGWWQSIPALIEALDTAGEGWRNKQTATVTVPLANTTDAAGLASLRRIIADYNAVLASRSMPNDFSLVFETTEEGLAALHAFEHALDLDEPLTLEAPHAPKIIFPEWHRRIYGHAPLIELTSMRKGTTSPAETDLVLRIEVDSPEGHAEYPYVDLRRVAHGRKRLKLTNQHQALPLVFTFENEGDRPPTFGFRVERLGRTAHEARDVAIFLLAIASPAAVVRISHFRTGDTIASFSSTRFTGRYDVSERRRLREVLDKLCYVQQRITHVGAFRLDDALGLSPEDETKVDALFEIFRHGRMERTISGVAFEVPPGAEGHGIPTIAGSGMVIKLLSLEIPLGDMRGWLHDVVPAREAIRAATVKASSTNSPVLVELENLHIVEEYPAWLPGNQPWAAMYEALDTIGEKAAPSDGYFTRTDARAAGASDTIFDALLAEHKIEPVASNIYRLVHFPRSDQEELVTLWLQTDRQGVVSHDSALLLHELSDILPARRHVTVPPGWDQGDRILDPDIDLHSGEVAEHEVRWIGPVPYTAPLRTVRDCIDEHLSPDLLEQAIEQGLRRRLFRIDDLPPPVRAGAA